MLLYLDSFDHYSAAQGTRKWTTFGASSLVTGRTGNCALMGGAASMTKTLGAEYSTLTAGVAHKANGFANSIFQFLNANLTQLKCYLWHVGDGRLYFQIELPGFFSGNSSPSTFVMSAGQWYYFECQMALSFSAPALTLDATCRVNGAEILSYSLTDSAASAASFATIGLGSPGGVPSAYYDDFYCTEDEFLGDIRIGVLYPNAAGDSTVWTPNGAGANWEKVKEHPADDDTTYVSTPTLGALDLYNIDDIDPAFTGDIKGAQALWLAKKSDEGAGSIKGQWKSGSTTIEGEEFFVSAASYLYSIQAERKSLFTAADWSHAEIDGLQLGIKRET